MKLVCFVLAVLLSSLAFADDFTNILQDLAMQTACLGKYSNAEAGNYSIPDPHDYYTPEMMAERFSKMSGNRTRIQTFYGICFDYAQAAWDDIKRYQASYNRAGMKNQEWYIAAVDDNPNYITLYDPIPEERVKWNGNRYIDTRDGKYLEKYNGVYCKKKYSFYVMAHGYATNHAWLWVQRTDGTWYWIDPTWTDNTGYVWYGYVAGGIDPEFVNDVATGNNVEYDIKGRKCYGFTYGSWKGGIALMYLDAVSLKPVNPLTGEELDVPADSVEGAFGKCIAGGYGASYEGAQVIFNSDTGYYYCFVSMGWLDWEYRVGVGRSKSVEGPFIDGSGRSMLLTKDNAGEYHAISSKIIGSCALDGEYSFRCQGGQSILRTADGKILFACHSRTNFLPGYFFFLQVHQMFFNSDGWPILNQNEFYEDSSIKETLSPISKSEVAGVYDTILTVRGTELGDFQPYGQPTPVPAISQCDAIPTASKEMTLSEDGGIGGAYSGTWTLEDDGYSVVFDIDGIGTFKGYVLNAVDWAKKKGNSRRVLTFTAFDGSKTGEYLWGNKRK